MSQTSEKFYSPEEYLALEEKSDRKSEYYNGKIYLMSGATYNHNLICSNALFQLRLSLQGSGCSVVPSDMRVLIQEDEFYTYPDVSVICGEPEFLQGRSDTVTNPIMLVEVLSPSTFNYDRGQKFVFYRAIESLQIYLIIDQLEFSVECYQKLDDHTWQLTTYNQPDQEIELVGLGVSLKVSALYEGVIFPPKSPKKRREKIIPHPTMEN
jgi:Uma2 family endonuclease